MLSEFVKSTDIKWRYFKTIFVQKEKEFVVQIVI